MTAHSKSSPPPRPPQLNVALVGDESPPIANIMSCPACRRRLRAPKELQAKTKVRCRSCGHAFRHAETKNVAELAAPRNASANENAVGDSFHLPTHRMPPPLPPVEQSRHTAAW